MMLAAIESGKDFLLVVFASACGFIIAEQITEWVRKKVHRG